MCRRGGERQGALWFPVFVGYPSPPRPCGSLCVFHVLWVIAPAPPRLLRQEAWWEGGGIPWGTSTVTWMTCACLLSAGGGGGAIPWGGGPATRRRGTIYTMRSFTFYLITSTTRPGPANTNPLLNSKSHSCARAEAGDDREAEEVTGSIILHSTLHTVCFLLSQILCSTIMYDLYTCIHTHKCISAHTYTQCVHKCISIFI